MIADRVKKLEDTLTLLAKALSEGITMEADGVKIDQRMFGQLENLNIGDNSSVVINQSIVLTTEAKEKIIESIETLREFRALLPSPDLPLGQALDAYKQMLILDSLEKAEGNQTRAAKLLGANHRTVSYFIKAKGGDELKKRIRKFSKKQIVGKEVDDGRN